MKYNQVISDEWGISSMFSCHQNLKSNIVAKVYNSKFADQWVNFLQNTLKIPLIVNRKKSYIEVSFRQCSHERAAFFLFRGPFRMRNYTFFKKAKELSWVGLLYHLYNDYSYNTKSAFGIGKYIKYSLFSSHRNYYAELYGGEFPGDKFRKKKSKAKSVTSFWGVKHRKTKKIKDRKSKVITLNKIKKIYG
jgi:hypothetical protein